MSKTRGGFSLVLSLLLAGTASCSDDGGTEPPLNDTGAESAVEAGDETAVDTGTDVEADSAIEETGADADDASLDAADSTVVDDSADTSVDDGADTSVADSADTSVADSADTSVADSADTSVADSADTSVADSADTSVADATDASDAADADDATDATDAGDTGISCTVAGDCPGVDTECARRECVSNRCSIAFTTAGTALAAQTTGDCKTAQCDGSGGVTQVANGSDLPNDGNDCTDDVCTGTTPSNPAKSASTACGAGGSKLCDGAGACVECLGASTCPGVDDDCKTRTCVSNVCGFSYRTDGTAISTQTTGDCKKVVCNGTGGTKTVNDDTDVNDDSNVCTTDACSSGTATHTPVSSGTSCGGSKVCDSTGTCVGCVTKDDCAGVDDDCKVRTCTSGVCGFSYTADLTPVTAQTAGDCKKVVCDGAGSTKSINDDADVNDDTNACTTDACSSGTATHTPVSSGTDCGGGKKCNAGGTCVECLAATDCPGTDTECATRTCVSNTCGWSYASVGTVLTTQTAGDCKEKQCNGSGVIVDVAADVDLPVDGNACTDDVCAAGVPSNPLKSEGSSCTGGGVCTAAGACVQCLTASNCPSTGTECAVRTCVSNVCGVSNVSAGIATSSQTAGDCKENQCDGSGNVVSVTAALDVPADDGNSCTSETCSGSTPTHPAVDDGTTCSTGVCSSGSCVACRSAPDCPGTDSECATRTCVSNTCGWSYASAGTPLSSGLQTVGDCQEKQCDGSGNVTSVAADTDVNLDAKECTNDICTSGVPSHPAKTAGTACGTGGSLTCDGAGSCGFTVWVSRVGTGTGSLGTGATAAFIDKIGIDVGALTASTTSTVATLPTATSGSNSPLTLAGTASSEGALARSGNGSYVTIAGYATAPGTATPNTSTTIARVIGRIDSLGSVDTTNVLPTTSFAGSNVRAAVTNDGTAYWVSGTASSTANAGIRYFVPGATTDTQLVTTPTNARWLNIYNGQLYGTSGSGTYVNVFSVGSGLPTSSTTATTLPGMTTTSGPSPYGFVLFDRDSGVAGVDTLYVADDRSVSAGGGVQKWTLGSGGTWTLAATYSATGITAGFRGLAGTIIGTKVYLVALTTEALPKVVLFVEDGVTTTSAVLATSATNTAFRGVALAPQ